MWRKQKKVVEIAQAEIKAKKQLRLSAKGVSMDNQQPNLLSLMIWRRLNDYNRDVLMGQWYSLFPFICDYSKEEIVWKI